MVRTRLLGCAARYSLEYVDEAEKAFLKAHKEAWPDHFTRSGGEALLKQSMASSAAEKKRGRSPSPSPPVSGSDDPQPSSKAPRPDTDAQRLGVGGCASVSVSYTHLTLPTKRIV